MLCSSDRQTLLGDSRERAMKLRGKHFSIHPASLSIKHDTKEKCPDCLLISNKWFEDVLIEASKDDTDFPTLTVARIIVCIIGNTAMTEVYQSKRSFNSAWSHMARVNYLVPSVISDYNGGNVRKKIFLIEKMVSQRIKWGDIWYIWERRNKDTDLQTHLFLKIKRPVIVGVMEESLFGRNCTPAGW